MKYRIEISEEQLRVIGLVVDEYMRLRMGQFDAFAEELALDGVEDRIEAYKDDYQRGILNERGYSIERMFEAAYKMAYPPHGCRGRQHDSWERASTLYTPSSTSSGWIPRWKSENPPGRQIAHSSLSRWGMSRSRRLRGWKNELPVL